MLEIPLDRVLKSTLFGTIDWRAAEGAVSKWDRQHAYARQ